MADKLGNARQGTATGIAPSSPAGVGMRDIVSAEWYDAPGRVCTLLSNSANRNRHCASLPCAPSMCVATQAGRPHSGGRPDRGLGSLVKDPGSKSQDTRTQLVRAATTSSKHDTAL